MPKGLLAKERRTIVDKLVLKFKASSPNFELQKNDDWDQMQSATLTQPEPEEPKRQTTNKADVWKPRNWAEMQVQAPVISFAKVLRHLGEEGVVTDKKPKQGRREREDRMEMGSEEHKLWYKAIRGEFKPDKHDFVRGRMNDSAFQNVAGRSKNLGFISNERLGANFDSRTERGRIFIARDQYFQIFNSSEFEDEITGFIPWFVKGKPIFFAGRNDVLRFDGTVDGKFGQQELSHHATCLTLTRDTLVRRVRFQGIRRGGPDAKFYQTDTSLENFAPEIRGGNRHCLFYTQKIVDYGSIGYSSDTAIYYHRLICQAVSEIADEMIQEPEFDKYFV